MTTDPVADLTIAAARARHWLCDVAAPLWADRGRTSSGLFAERMTRGGVPDSAYYRVFVQARHIFAFAEIGAMGWQGPWRERIAETIDTLIAAARRPDGFYVHRLDAAARPLDSRADLYDQAFMLLALATAAKALGDARYCDTADPLLDSIEQQWAHPAGGFTEGEIVDPSLRRQNPHMHLLEACLALAEASPRPRYAAAAQRIAELAARHFRDPGTGALLEYFTDDLRPAAGLPGRLVEPGHCFEWAWLFERMAARGCPDAIAIADRLVGFARTHGIDRARNVAINEVLTDGTPHDRKARLWPQTERIKAAAIRYRRSQDVQEAAEAAAAAAGLEQYFAVATPGLWYDKLCPDGSWLDELAPGSSLYHIVTAYAELNASAARVDG